jgi:hypothetical protein
MKRIYSIILSTLTILGFISCSDYLDTKPGDKYDDGAIWISPNLVENFVFNIYDGIPYPFQWYTNASLVDEAIPVQNDGVATRVTTCTMTPDEKGAFAPDNWARAMDNWWWSQVYNKIRSCNMFFKNIEDVPFTSQAYKEQLIGEVYFLRGYFYYLLLAQYGGVPLIDYVVNIGDNYNIPRNTLEETVDFIVKDLDEATVRLKESGQSDKTRGTEGAALALKARVLLYAASDLFNSKASWAPGYSNPELVSYMDDNRRERWEAAKKAAEEVMKLNYSLYDVDDDPSENFANLFLQMNSNEQIFITIYDKINWPFWGTDWLSIYNPQGAGGYALSQVSGNLANAFENSDGAYFDFNAKAQDPFVDRDPRFYASILYDGCDWVYPDWGWWMMLPYQVHSGRWKTNKGGYFLAPDYGSRDNGNINTGYFIRKFIDPNTFQAYYGARQSQPYIQIRYAEILLNYAEACIALGEEGNARTAINQIRKRAGMPEITDSGENLVKRYRNERRVELAWEQHRFFDVRRWMIAPEAYGQIKGVDTLYPAILDEDNPVYDYSDPVHTEIIVETRNWNNSHYLIPIGRSETQKNQALIQNPLYQ